MTAYADAIAKSPRTLTDLEQKRVLLVSVCEIVAVLQVSSWAAA